MIGSRTLRYPALLVSVSLLLCVTASAQSLFVRLLGTGGPGLSTDRAEAGLLVLAGPEVLLFDCGRGIPERLAQLNLARISVSNVFLTHLHSDHTEGLPILWMNEFTWSARNTTPLSVWGPGTGPDQPTGTTEMTTSIANAYATNTHIRRDLVEHLPGGGIQFQTNVINSEGVVYQNNGVTVTAFVVDHGPVKPALGYRIDYQGHSVVFSGDTTASTNLVKNAQGADVLIHEVLIPPLTATPANDAILAYHTTPEQAAGVFSQVMPKLAMYTHIVDQIGAGAAGLIRRTRAAGYTGPLEVGDDLALISIGDSVSTQHCVDPSKPPAITAVTDGSYQNKISAGQTVIVWGGGFNAGGNNALVWYPAGGGQSVTLNEQDGSYFWDQSTGQINATLSPGITHGQWLVEVSTGECSRFSQQLPVFVN
jgi:ribonuclease Z